jgi:LacI family transcriptional regulator
MGTIDDVAREAGVSIATVSRVLNGSTRVNADATSRVLAAVEKLQYRPSHAARALRAQRATTIGLLISDIQNPFFTGLVRGVEDIAQQHGHSVILCNSDEDPKKERQYVDVLCAEHVAGAIIVPASEHSQSFQRFRELNIPLVAVDRRLEGRTTDAVLVDNVRGAYDAVLHLTAAGYRRIGLITGPIATTTGKHRREGYRRALAEAGISRDPTLERIGTFKERSGAELAAELLALDPPIDALFITNNLMTLGALETLHARGVRIPDDVAVVAFDDAPWASLPPISLTTVSQPVYELGTTAANRLFQRMQENAELSHQEIVLSPTLCIRRSSRPRSSPSSVPVPLGSTA